MKYVLMARVTAIEHKAKIYRHPDDVFGDVDVPKRRKVLDKLPISSNSKGIGKTEQYN